MIVGIYNKVTFQIIYVVSGGDIDLADYETDDVGAFEMDIPLTRTDVPAWYRPGYPIPGVGYSIQYILQAKDTRYSWDWSSHTYVPDIPRATEAARHRVTEGRDFLRYGFFTWSGHVFGASVEQQGVITGYATEALVAHTMSTSFSATLTLADNSTLAVDGANMLAIFAAMQTHVRAADDQGVALFAAIEIAAASASALDAVNALRAIDWVAP